MSGLFDDREKAQENKYAHDQELAFKIGARANKLFGMWAAGEMHYTPTEALEYALSVVETGLKHSGEWDVISKVGYDLKRKGRAMDEADLKDHYRELFSQAEQQIKRAPL